MARSEQHDGDPAATAKAGPSNEDRARMATQRTVEPHTRQPIEMRGVDPMMVRSPLSAADEMRRKELTERGPQAPEEHEELAKLNERGEVPPELTAEGRDRLHSLEHKGELSAEDAARLKRLQAAHADERADFSPDQQRQLDALMARGPRTKEEDEEMRLLQKAVADRQKYEEERREIEEKEAAGPFPVEQWLHLTAYIERAIQNRHGYAGRVPRS